VHLGCLPPDPIVPALCRVLGLSLAILDILDPLAILLAIGAEALGLVDGSPLGSALGGEETAFAHDAVATLHLSVMSLDHLHVGQVDALPRFRLGAAPPNAPE